jgi:hypothetical protein
MGGGPRRPRKVTEDTSPSFAGTAQELVTPFEPVKTAIVGTNADLMAEAARLYLEPGWRVADVTYAQGVFWQQIDTADYEFLPSDLTTGVDFRALPYEADSLDALVLDPPYTPNHDNDLKRSVAKPYNLDSAPRSTPAIVALYAGGIAEAGRCLRRGGRLFVKCQDAVENHRRHWTHVNILNIAQSFGFDAIDKFVLVQATTPAMRHRSQKRARSNHSYLWVFDRRGFPW